MKSGFISIIGRPNVGKSTLLNNLLGSKVSIVSDKPQTTRNQILGIHTKKEGQAVFLDNPGIHKPLHQLNKRMMEYVYSAFEDADIICLLIDISQKWGKGDEFALELVNKYEKPKFALINKIDLLKKSKALPLIEKISKRNIFDEIIPISALKKTNFKVLEEKLFEYLPEGPLLYPEDIITTSRRKFIVAEIIREKILHFTREEIPYSVAVIVKEIEGRGKLLYIAADILVERKSQKRIVIGSKGSMISQIGKKAREELEFLVGKKVFLDLKVRHQKNWRDKSVIIQQINQQMGED